MQQFTLSLDDPQDITSRLELTPEREQRLIALMAEAILAVLQDSRRQTMTNADAAHKITRAHHSRKAVVYLRQDRRLSLPSYRACWAHN